MDPPAPFAGVDTPVVAAGADVEARLRLGSHARGMLLVLGAAAGFGTLGTLANFAYRADVTPAGFAALRAALGAAILAAWVHGTGREVKLRTIPRRQRVALAAAVVANALLNLFYFAAFSEMVVALVLAVYFIYPVLVAIGSVALGRERFTRARVVGLGLSIAGLLLVLGSQAGADARLTAAGVALAAAAATCQATYLVIARAGFPAVPPDQVTGIVLTGGLLLAAPIALSAGDVSTLVGWIGDPRAVLAVVLAGTVGAAVAKVWALMGVRRIGGTRTAVILLAEPVVGVACAALFLAQPITAPEIAGGGLILAGALLVQRPSVPPSRAVPESHAAPDQRIWP